MAIVYGTNASNVISSAHPPFLKGTTNGADTVYGLGGDDEIYGHGGNDTLVGGASADDLDGDTASTRQTIEIPRKRSEWASDFLPQRKERLISIENLAGSAYGDWLEGDAGGNVLKGNERRGLAPGARR